MPHLAKSESRDVQMKRMTMRSWRRGTKEMDLILGPYADVHLVQMDEAGLLAYDALLDEADTDLLPWIMGQRDVPSRVATLIAQIATFARTRFI
jgi:antitoxin CptB